MRFSKNVWEGTALLLLLLLCSALSPFRKLFKGSKEEMLVKVSVSAVVLLFILYIFATLMTLI